MNKYLLLQQQSSLLLNDLNLEEKLPHCQQHMINLIMIVYKLQTKRVCRDSYIGDVGI